jgi:hypothetical protein
MKRYGLFFKNSDEAISNVKSKSLEEAKTFFLLKKNLSEDQFDIIFEVRHII